MPLNSIEQYVQGQADGLEIPGGTQTLTSYITAPTPAKLSGPLAFIGDIRLSASRESMPRGMGFKNLVWTVNVYLAYSSTGKSPMIDQQFPLIADALMKQLWTTEMPTTITDPTTGQVSRVMSVGEQFTLDKARLRTVGAQQQLYYAARFGFEIKELLQG